MEFLGFAFVLHDDDRLLVWARLQLEGPQFHVLLDNGVVELAANESFGVKDGVGGVLGGLVFGGITDKSLFLIESNIGRGGSVALVIGNNFNSFILPDTDTGVGGTQIDSNGFALYFLFTHFLNNIQLF
jgi:hypothetical protein